MRDGALADERAGGRERVGEDPQPFVLAGADGAAASHPEGDDLGVLQALVGEQLEERLLLGVRGGEAGLDHVDAELVEGVDDAQLLLCRERQPTAAHAVAQGCVVELDRGHQPVAAVCGGTAAADAPATPWASPVGVCSAGALTTSSHSR